MRRRPIESWIFRRLLRLYPSAFRQSFEGELVAFYVQDRDRAEARGSLALLRFWSRTLLDLARSSLRQRFRSHRRPAALQPTTQHPAPPGGFEMGSVLHDLKVTARALASSPGFFAVALGALALGIGATTAIWSVVDGVLVRSLPYPESGRLVEVGTVFGHDPEGFGSVDLADFRDLRATSRTMDRLVASGSESRTLVGEGEPRIVSVGRVSRGFFDLLGGEAAAGRLLIEGDYGATSADVVVLADSTWESAWGGDPTIVGRSILLDGEPHQVVGVVSEGFVPPEALWTQAGVQAWAPLRVAAGEAGEASAEGRRGAFQYNVVGRLAPGVGLEAARAEADALYATLGEEHYGGNVLGARVESLRGRTVGDVGSTLGVLFAASALLLLIACANVAHLLLARGIDRSGELAVRSALGASRGRLARQLLTEQLVLVVLGGTGGSLLAFWGVEGFKRFDPGGIPRLAEVAVDARVLAFALLVSAATGILFGLAPALRTSRIPAAAALQGSAGTTTAGRARTRLRSALVVVETALSFVLLVGAVLLVNSFVRLVTIDPGFDPEGLVTVQVTAREPYAQRSAWIPFFREIEERVEAIGGVTEASLTSALPYTGDAGYYAMTPEGWDEASGEDSAFIATLSVSPEHLDLLGVPVVAGRGLTADDRPGAPRVALVNRAFVRQYWPDADPDDGSALGRRVAWSTVDPDDPWVTVVGVIGDVRYRPDRAALPEVWVPFAQTPQRRMTVVARTDGATAPLAGAMRQAVWEVDADLPIRRLATMRQVSAESLTEPRFYAALLAGFAVTAVLLALVGVYGATAHAVVRRTREMGIRHALGARPGDLATMVVTGGMRLVALGVAVGLMAAIATTRLLAGFLFAVEPTDPASFGMAAALFLTTGTLAAWVPARRAARLDPVESLRME